MGAFRPGQLLEGTSYRVVRELGAGGMGVVYEIEHVRLKKRYVAKVIHEQIREDAAAAKRMEREAEVLAAISHPNIVQVHDIGTTSDGISYFVMEKLEGVDLRHAMKDGVSRRRAIEIVIDVLEALAYIHRRGIVHRDIKPGNVFLAEGPQGTSTKILDFGIVHVFDGDGRLSSGRLTKTGGFIGTLYYAAPEQMQGTRPGPPNDVYAAALILFELLAGKGPFDDDPGVGLSRCFKPAPRLREVVPDVPAEVSDLLAKALEQEPAVSPNAGVLAASLRRIGNQLEGSREVAGAVVAPAIEAAPAAVPPIVAAPRGEPSASPPAVASEPHPTPPDSRPVQATLPLAAPDRPASGPAFESGKRGHTGYPAKILTSLVAGSVVLVLLGGFLFWHRHPSASVTATPSLMATATVATAADGIALDAGSAPKTGTETTPTVADDAPSAQTASTSGSASATRPAGPAGTRASRGAKDEKKKDVYADSSRRHQARKWRGRRRRPVARIDMRRESSWTAPMSSSGAGTRGRRRPSRATARSSTSSIRASSATRRRPRRSDLRRPRSSYAKRCSRIVRAHERAATSGVAADSPFIRK